MIHQLRVITVATFGGGAVGVWSATAPTSWTPLLGLAALAALTGWAMSNSPIAVVAAMTTALSGVAGRSFGYAGVGPTEIWELVVPLLPITAGIAWLIFEQTSASRGEILKHIRSHWPLWGLAGWGITTAIWATRPAIALLVSSSWVLVLLGIALSRASAWILMQGFVSGCWVFLAASNVRASLAPVDRPFGSDGAALLPVDKIVGFAEDTTELADIGVAAAFAALLLPSRVGAAFGFLLASATVLRTDQRAGIVALAVGTLALGLLAKGRATRAVAVGLLLAIVAVASAGIATGTLNRGAVARTPSGDDVASLSGRTEIWTSVWAARSNWLALGSGPGAEEVAVPTSVEHLTINLHNRPLQLAVTLGAVGLALATGALALVVRRWRILPVPLLAGMAAILTSGLTAPGFGAVGLTPAVLALLIVVIAAGAHQRQLRPASLSGTST